MPDERVLVTAGLAAVVALLLATAASLGAVARAAPLAIGLPTLLLLIIELRRDHKRGSRQGAEEHLPGERATIAWTIGLLLPVAVLGVILGAPAWLACYLRFRSGERWSSAVSVAGVLVIALYAVLTLLLGIAPGADGAVDWARLL